jgi:2-polyprenyl-3-methyl-5-hydroxy-6-metoxy-1,4-benzoquinol methylase
VLNLTPGNKPNLTAAKPRFNRHWMGEEFLTLSTALPVEALKEKLRLWEPWSHRLDFDNGVSTCDFVRRTPFSDRPLSKFGQVETAIPFAELTGGQLLDVGCNAGYNSIHAAVKYHFRTTGIDFNQRHIEVSRFLADLANASCEFLLESAETFTRPAEFDVVLHFGTLYHLENPWLSLRQTFRNLKPGGYLALETQVYDHPDDPNICYFMHMQNNDPTNFWALSTPVLKKLMDLIGFRNVREIKKVFPPILSKHMGRIILVAQKPAS